MASSVLSTQYVVVNKNVRTLLLEYDPAFKDSIGEKVAEKYS